MAKKIFALPKKKLNSKPITKISGYKGQRIARRRPRISNNMAK